MNNQAWADARAALERRRQRNEQEADRRRAEIAKRSPDLNRLLEQRHEMILRSVRSAFDGGSPSDAEAAMAEYNQKISAQLVEMGYPADYLAPRFDCPLCRDTGFVYDQSIQKTCECLKKEYLAALSREGEYLAADQTFAHFDETRFPEEPLPGTDVTQREYMRVVRDRCRQFADGVPDGPLRTLLLHGGSGLGKTFLLHCVGNAARARGVDVVYVTAYDLLMALKTAYFSRGDDSAREFFDAPLLLIDDLGMEPLMENITVEQMYNLLNARLIRGRYTAISTNLGRVELKQKYTERVTSRLLDTRTGMAIPFQGRDIRLIRE